ncbi:MAG: hypothetical protein OEV93_01245 [Candidatus Moranbacteria bacterium]|nr:hypothetical protein [Candidatus Moranbacteria bacterium]
MLLQELLAKFGFSYEFAGDIALFLIFIMISIGFGLFIGRFKLVNVLINIYISIAILSVIPEVILGFHDNANIFLFFIMILILSLADNNLFDIHISGSGNSFFWRLFLMSFFEMGLIFSVVISMLPKKLMLEYVTPEAYSFFASEYAGLLWMIVPLIFLVFINKNQK